MAKGATFTGGNWMEIDRLISSDSHVRVSHDQVKAHLASKFHDEYDDATGQFVQSMSANAAAKANQAGMINFNYPAFGRPGRR